MAQLANLTKDIETAVNGLGSKKTIPSPEEEQQLLIAARKLVDRLEGPELGVWRVLNGVSIQKNMRSSPLYHTLLYLLGTPP